jgi:hypothetical protein
MCMDTAAAMYRLEQLRQVFLNITSPQHLTDTMAEGGCLLAHLIQQQWVPANDFFKDQAAAALVDPVPRWDTDTQMFRRWGLWQLYANEYSDSPRTVLHTQPAVGPGWIVRRSTQAADQTEPVVTETELPRTDVTQQTKWGQDYAQQGQRYALFVSELLAELVKQERTVTEQDVPAAVPPAGAEPIPLTPDQLEVEVTAVVTKFGKDKYLKADAVKDLIKATGKQTSKGMVQNTKAFDYYCERWGKKRKPAATLSNTDEVLDHLLNDKREIQTTKGKRMKPASRSRDD